MPKAQPSAVEPDSLSLDFVLSQGRSIVKVQPDTRDLHWIQIEDFVELFNRCVIIRDMVTSEEQTYVSKRVVSKWIPGMGTHFFIFWALHYLRIDFTCIHLIFIFVHTGYVCNFDSMFMRR